MARPPPCSSSRLSRLALALLCALALGPAHARAQASGGLQVRPTDDGLRVERAGVEVGRLALPARPRDVLLEGRSAWVALGREGLWRVDLSDPAVTFDAMHLNADGNRKIAEALAPHVLALADR